MRPVAELIERAALADLHAAADAELSEALGLQVMMIDSALVSIASELPASAITINRTVGLGLEQAASEAGLKAIVDSYREAGVSSYFIHCHPQADPDSLPDALANLGFKRARAWQQFSRGREALPTLVTDLKVREVGQEHADDFAIIVCEAFDLGDDAIPWLARLPGRDNWHIFMSFDGDTPIGTGAIYIQGQYAWAEFGATAPEFRHRGSQAVVLAKRVQCAIDAGCREIMTSTGEEVPGDTQHSYKNMLRLGFKEAATIGNFEPIDA